MTQHHGSAADFAALKGMRPFDEFEITSGSGAGNTYRYYGQYGWAQTSTAGAALVYDTANPSGIGLKFWLDVVAATLPTEAGSGCILHTNGFRNPKISSVMVSAGTVPLTAINTTVRWCFAESDAAAAILLPTTFPSGLSSNQAFDSGSFNLIPQYVPDTEAAGDLRVCQLVLPPDLEIQTSAAVTRFYMAHNITGVTLIFGIGAVEEVA